MDPDLTPHLTTEVASRAKPLHFLATLKAEPILGTAGKPAIQINISAFRKSALCFSAQFILLFDHALSACLQFFTNPMFKMML
jgi:hypothetical protein